MHEVSPLFPGSSRVALSWACVTVAASVLTRNEANQWQSPLFITLTGGSVGFQAGVEATDFVLVFRTQKSVNGLMQGKITIGVDAAAAAGPVGRQASAATDITLQAEILSYSRSRGLFAGVSIDGSALQIDHAAGQAFYRGLPTVPPSALQLMNLLTSYSGAAPATAAAVPPGQTVAAQPAPAAVPSAAAPSVAVPAAAVPSAAGRPPEQVRQQLAKASQNLQGLLDDQWRAFLALPSEVYVPSQPTHKSALERALSNYETVAKDPSFAALAQRAEFKTTHQLLKEYASYQIHAAAPSPQISLPPPPAGAQRSTGRTVPRY